MENIRLILVVSLVFVSLLIWQAWQRDYHQPVAQNPQVQQTRETGTAAVPAPSLQQDLPEITEQESQVTAAPAPAAKTVPHAAGRKLKISTDVIDARIDLRGGTLSRLVLRRYPQSSEQQDQPFVLLDDRPTDLFVAQGGLVGGKQAPTHHVLYQADQDSYRLQQGRDVLDVILRWQAPDGGLRVEKHYRFQRGSYLVRVDYRIHNQGDRDWRGRLYAQLQRKENDSGKSGFIRTFTGAVISSPDKRYEKISFKDIEEQPLKQDIADGWVAMAQHYFLAALLPQDKATYSYYTRALPDQRYVIGMYGPPLDVPAGAVQEASYRMYLGPKLQQVLAGLAPGLELTADYGMLWFLAKPIYWLLEHIHGLVGNWGWSIILLTMLIKGAFFKLSATSYKSMAKMRKVQPRMVAMKERFKDDRAGLNKAMMDLYKKEKINPLGGCLPILVQIPVFLALYWVLLETVELRDAPFILWIKSLSAADPYFVLPLLMGISMFVQQRLNPAPMDPMQQKVMSILPIVFTVFFAFFPAGLVLYWVVNNILSIAQQWVITRQIEAAA